MNSKRVRIGLFSLLSSLPILAANVLAHAALPGEDTSYVPIKRSVGIRITNIKPSWAALDYTESSDHYFNVSLDGVRSGDAYVDYCTKGNLWYAHATCSCCGFEPVSGSQPEFTANVLSCRDDVAVRIEEHEYNLTVDDDFVLNKYFYLSAKGGPPTGIPDLINIGDTYFLQDPDTELGGVGFQVIRGPEGPLGGDQDGDGLLDHWEQYGYDANCDGHMVENDDVFLHQMGARVDHKDLFYQIDSYSNATNPNAWKLAKATIDEVVAAFARAPIDATGLPNPDGQPGIDLHVDHFDRGNIPTKFAKSHFLAHQSHAPTSNADWSTKREALTVGGRTGLFKFGMVGPIWDSAGGYGSGDFIYLLRTDARALMHEIGHTLGLTHGGNDDLNCKPNHLSIMNYLYSGRGLPYGHPTNGLSRYIDYAPPLVPPDPELLLNVRLGSLAPFNIDENSLSEATALAPVSATANPVHEMFLVNSTNTLVRSPVSRWPNWNQNFNGPGNSVPIQDPGTYRAQVDVFDGWVASCSAAENGGYRALGTRDEWRNLSLKPTRTTSGAQIPGAFIYTGTEPPAPTPDQEAQFERALHMSDLRLSVSMQPNPIRAGQTASFTIGVANRGFNPADQPRVAITLPGGFVTTSLPTECSAPVGGESVCSLQILGVGATRTLQFSGVVQENNTGGPRQVAAQIVDAVGTDTNPSDNASAVRLRVLPTWSSFEDNARPWLQSWNPAAGPFPQNSRSSDAQYSMEVECGYFDIDSPLFNTSEWDVISDRIAVDVYVPAVVPNSTWVGQVALSFSAQSAGMSGLSLGVVPLTSLPRGSWSTIEFAVPANVRATLLSDTPNASVRLSTNTSLCSDKLLVDNLRFVGSLIERRTFHAPNGGGQVVTSSGVLTFDNVVDWSSQQATLVRDTANKTQGAASLSFAPTSWTEIVSRKFSTNELTNVSPLLNVDVFIPSFAQIPNWVGRLQVYFDCPAAGIWNDYVGQSDLDNRFDGEFNSTAAVSHLFAISGRIQTALNGGFSGCQFRLGIAANTALGTIKLDRGGFVQ